MEIKGQVDSIVYYNEENGYTVCNLDVNNELITDNLDIPSFLRKGNLMNS